MIYLWLLMVFKWEYVYVLPLYSDLWKWNIIKESGNKEDLYDMLKSIEALRSILDITVLLNWIKK